MELERIQKPDIDKPWLKANEIGRMIINYVDELENQLRYVLNNLDEQNMNAELTGKIREADELVKAFRRNFTNTTSANAAEQTAQKLNLSAQAGTVSAKLKGAEWRTITIDGTEMQVLVKGAGA